MPQRAREWLNAYGRYDVTDRLSVKHSKKFQAKKEFAVKPPSVYKEKPASREARRAFRLCST